MSSRSAASTSRGSVGMSAFVRRYTTCTWRRPCAARSARVHDDVAAADHHDLARDACVQPGDVVVHLQQECDARLSPERRVLAPTPRRALLAAERAGTRVIATRTGRPPCSRGPAPRRSACARAEATVRMLVSAQHSPSAGGSSMPIAAMPPATSSPSSTPRGSRCNPADWVRIETPAGRRRRRRRASPAAKWLLHHLAAELQRRGPFWSATKRLSGLGCRPFRRPGCAGTPSRRAHARLTTSRPSGAFCRIAERVPGLPSRT